jgi:putative chitinase
MFDRTIYFDQVRESVFGGEMIQSQVDGQDALLSAWERHLYSQDLRFMAYMLATTFHETAATMQPIEEYGRGAGHEYGEPDPTTGQTYFGRGFVQLTWADNYSRATAELWLTGADDLYWHPARALDLAIAGRVMWGGMNNGWFTGKRLDQYFDEEKDDPVGARQIINPDDKGELIAGYHAAFLKALESAWSPSPPPAPEPITIRITIEAPLGVAVMVNGEPLE